MVRSELHNIELDQFINKGIDSKDRLKLHPRVIRADANPFEEQEDKRNIFYIEELENLEWDEIFLDLLKESQ